MKTKFLAIAIASICLINLNAFGQTISGQQDYTSGFTAIEVGDYFTASVQSADYYGVDWTVDDALKTYMHVYLRGNTLVANVDRKSFDKETKKLYSGKKAASAMLRVIIYAPSVEKISVSDNAVVDATQFNIKPETFEAQVDENGILKGLTVTANNVTLSATKKSSILDAVIDGGNISVNASNQANVELDQMCKNLSLQAEGTSTMSVKGETETADITSENSSKVTIDGSAVTLILVAGGKEVHAEGLAVNDAKVVGSNSCKAYVNASENISLDLKGGSLVSFAGKPVIDIVNIQNSSVSHLIQ